MCRWLNRISDAAAKGESVYTLQGKSHYVFLFCELRGLNPNFHIHASMSVLFIPRICPHIWLQQTRQTDPGYTYINLSQIYECWNWETEHFSSVLEIRRLHSFISGNT
jgi:hypothetical protein